MSSDAAGSGRGVTTASSSAIKGLQNVPGIFRLDGFVQPAWLRDL
jgi:hypothetical protein